MSGPVPHPRYVFICGLHRSGTSLLARLLGAHPEISAITGAPVPENEGAYLQGAIPHTARHGIPGHYATDPAQHHVEGGRYDTLETQTRLTADWDPWFDPAAAWRMEKSPVNLTRMRLYQQLFPLAHFVIILRHPEAIAAAMGKWTGQDPANLIDYVLDAYELALADLEYVHCAAVLRYEDLAAAPGEWLARLLRFLDLTPIDPCCAVRDGNADYRGALRLSAGQAARAANYAYAPGLAVTPWPSPVRHPLRLIREGWAA